jgi:hypothetical protein
MVAEEVAGSGETESEDGPTVRDAAMAAEIARFVADRAFEFDDHECRAWALTDFEVWATLAGHEPELRFVGDAPVPE